MLGGLVEAYLLYICSGENMPGTGKYEGLYRPNGLFLGTLLKF